jgi:formamidopyrimidine-DNA glycosylase
VPELPETETIARDLDAMLAGAQINTAVVLKSDVLRVVSAADFPLRLSGTTILTVRRRAKLILIALSSGDTVVVQPRFTGALLVETALSDIADPALP